MIGNCLRCCFVSAVLFFLSPHITHAQPDAVIPRPQSMVWKTGAGFDLKKARPARSADFPQEAVLLQQMLDEKTPVQAGKGRENVFLLKQQGFATGGYQLQIDENQIQIMAGDAAGAYYGLLTLKQILASAGSLQLPPVVVSDQPRYPWRGMHLDCSRHFFTVDEVKRYIDYLAHYKMNVFHWHLTDDQGWRAEIKRYPELTRIGGWRKETLIGRPSGQMTFDGKPYGGFYSQDEMREVVAYAAARHITVVPEIEMPGHALAALSAYPALSCTGGPFETGRWWGVFEDVFCAGNDSTFIFLQNVLDEITAIFPSTYIHVGGDECPKERWKNCSKCQARMQAHQLKDEHALQSYFITRIEKHLNSQGRKLIGWDEILEGGLAPNAAVMSWQGTQGGIAAAQAGHYAVMTPGKPCYFDHYQSEDRSTEPLAIGGFNAVEAVYAYEPTPAALNLTERPYILGAQGNVWTEYMPDFEHVTYMILPRLPALSEVLWTQPENKDYADFIRRMKVHAKQFDAQKIPYAPHALK